MGWIESKFVWGLRPEFAEVFVGREAFEGLESSGEVVGPKEVGQVRFELVMGVVEVAFDRGILDGSIHALDLPMGPGMIGFGQPVFDSMNETEPVEGMATEARGWPLPVLRQIGELDAVVGEHGVDAVWNGLDERFEERCCGSHICFFNEFDDSELRGTVDGYEQVEIAFGGPHLGQVDVEEDDRIGVEFLPLRLVLFHVRKAADAMPLQATVKRRASELRDGGLQRVQTIVER